MPRLRPLLGAAATVFLASACQNPPPPAPAPAPVEAPAPAPPPEVESAVRLDSGIAYGDCAEAMRRAIAKPDLDVDTLASPVAYKPLPIDPAKIPKAVFGKDGYFEIRVEVLIDTSGKADMKTFNVVLSTHPWLIQSVKAAIPKYTFHPAILAGCKVPRIWKWGANPVKKPTTPPPATLLRPSDGMAGPRH